MALGEIHAGLDIGSHSLRLIIATEDEKGMIINAVAEEQTDAIVEGEIIDIDTCITHFKKLIGKYRISSVNVSVSSPSLIGVNHDDYSRVKGRVTENEIDETIIHGKHWSSYVDKYAVYIPNSFTLNNTIITKQPLNKKANSITVHYHLLALDKDVVERAKTLVENSGVALRLQSIGLLASSQFLLTAEQKKQGVCLVDIGHNLVSFSVFNNGDMLLNKSLALGDYMVENEIMLHYDCPRREAVRLKETYGFIDTVVKDEECLIGFHTNTHEEKFLASYDLSLLITQQYTQILTDIKNILQHYKIDSSTLKAGIMFIGGGAQMPNLRLLAVRIFATSAHIKHIDNNFLLSKNIAYDRRLIGNYRFINALATLMYQEEKEYLTTNTTIGENKSKLSRVFNSLRGKID